MKHTVTVSRRRRDLGHPDAYLLIRRAVEAAFTAEGVKERCEVNVLLTNDEGIRAINQAERGVDSATDVLSFPWNELTPGEFDPAACELDPETEELYLGDMVLDVPRCAQQGEEFGHGFDHELSYLAVHSTLHLLGYDHMDEGEQKKRMRAREKEIMEKLGI